MFRYLIVFITFIVLILVGVLYLKTEPEPEPEPEPKGVGDSISSTAISGSGSDNLSRVALVMGNGNYHNANIGKYPFDSLRNPVNDAKDIAKALKKLGFEVFLKTDVKTRTAMEAAVVAFWARLRETASADVGLFYFSGHGFQYNNTNYLVPAEAAIANRLNIKSKALETDYILEHLEDANSQGVNLMILDACRDTIPAKFFDDRKNKGLENLLKGGFANMKAPVGSLIAYSTAPNTTSWGGLPGERNSVYTKHLLMGLRKKPYLDVTHLLMNVRRGVIAETADDGKQNPWEHTSLTSPFCFKPPCMSESEYQRHLKMADSNPEASAQEIAELKAALQRQKEKIAELKKQQAETKPIIPSPNNAFVVGKVFRDRLKDGSLAPEMVWIPAGTFRMGDIQGGGSSDEKPVHRVSVKKFAMGRYEVTVGEFRQFVSATRYQTDAEKGDGCYTYDGGWKKVKDANWHNSRFSQTDNHPVTCVSWNDATAYTEWLSTQTGQTYRLPTEEAELLYLLCT